MRGPPCLAQELLVSFGEHVAIVDVVEHAAEDFAADRSGKNAGDDHRLASGEEGDQAVAAGPCLTDGDQSSVAAGLFAQTPEGT